MLRKLMFTLVGDGDEANIVAFVQGESPLVAHSSHPTFRSIVDFCRAVQNFDGRITDTELEKLRGLFDVAQALATKFEKLSERISTKDGKLFLDGEELNGTVVDVILNSMSQGLQDFTPLVLFIENMAINPNPGSVNQLYDWISANGLTISTDGMIVGYKGVRATDGGFESIHRGKAVVNGQLVTGSIPNAAGDVIEMPRGEVEFDPARGCHTGLHVGSYEYASSFAQGGLLEVRVNPRDVVSVPTDCGAQKMRVCRYEVVDTIDRPYTEAVIGADLADFEYGDLWGDGEGDEYLADSLGWSF